MRSGSRSRSPNRGEVEKSRKLYIANLPQGVSNAEVTNLFQEFGDITDVNVRNKDTFSFAFVEYSTIHQAEKALKGMNRTQYKGKEMKMEFSKPRAPRNEEGRGNRGQGRQRGSSSERGFNGRQDRERSRSRDKGFNQRSNEGRGGDRGGGNGDRPKGCFNCGKSGHFSRECPESKKPREGFSGERREFNGGNRGGDRFGGNRGGGNREQSGNNYRNNRSPIDRGSPIRVSRPTQDMDY